ncbi:Ubiquitin-like-specific protease 2 [Escovopsis weberi]|uniref:Ubiquitin-like-specific protease 2 n=1 Tax=Escovopsis weberi TaxID=150374 RepID=A0A0N0RT81_ESCWE|nr:Ubiquitin-like-specific protease 2 [Escovopsis weberi]
MIQRPRAGEADAKLLLELKDPEDADRLIKFLNGKSEPLDGVLEKTMEILWNLAQKYSASWRNRTTVDEDDIARLNEGEFLNDNLINFYLRYLQCKMEEEHTALLNKVYVFNTFFFEKLKSSKGKVNYDGVKSWTAKIDLLSYDYIVVPVNEHAHWYLAIICNAPNSVRDPKAASSLPPTQPDGASEVADPDKSPKIPPTARSMSEASQQADRLIKEQLEESTNSVAELSLNTPSSASRGKPADTTSPKLDSTQPKIITLDSLGSAHAPTCRALKEYLILEAKMKRGIDLALPPSVYILAYMREFLKDPDGVADKLLQKQDVGWNIQASQLRNEIRDLLLVLQEKQRALLGEEKEKKKGLRKKDASGIIVSASSTSPPIIPSPSPTPKLPGSFPESSPVEGSEETPEHPKPRSVSQEARSRQSINGGPHFSASVSLIGEGPKVARTRNVVELEARSPLNGYEVPLIARGDSTRPHVVQDSSSSEPEVKAVDPVGKRKRRPSLEITDERKVKPGGPLIRPPGRQRNTKSRTKSPYFPPIDDDRMKLLSK